MVVDGEGDRGQHPTLAVDSADTLYVAYQDADRDRLLLKTIAAGGEVGAAEVVDDGRREGDRNHSVGASASLRVSSDEIIVAYQDSASATLVVSRRSLVGDWTRSESAGGFGVGLALSGGELWTATGLYEAGKGRLDAQRWE